MNAPFGGTTDTNAHLDAVIEPKKHYPSYFTTSKLKKIVIEPNFRSQNSPEKLGCERRRLMDETKENITFYERV